MSEVHINYRNIGYNSFIEVEITAKAEEACDEGDKITILKTISVQELLKIAANIIDTSSFYKDIFDNRVF